MTPVPSMDEITTTRMKAVKLAYKDLKRQPENKGLENAFMTLLRDVVEALIQLYRPFFLKSEDGIMLDRQKILFRLEMLGFEGDLATAVYVIIVEGMVREGCRLHTGAE